MNIAQTGTFYYDYPNDRLKFENNEKYLVNFSATFIHQQDNFYSETGVCVCFGVGIGILKYDAFSYDAMYLGRENKYIEYIGKNFTTDHYLKGPHHIWFDVETKNAIRAWQPTNGLQVYSDWNFTAPDPKYFEIPKLCVKTPSCSSTSKHAPPNASNALTWAHSQDQFQVQDAVKSMKEESAQEFDFERAQRWVPKPEYKGSNFPHMSHTLNNHLLNRDGLETTPCDGFSIEELNQLGAVLLSRRSAALQEVYTSGTPDPRRLRFSDAEIAEKWKEENQLSEEDPDYQLVRDGKCHELVMWFVHQLTQASQQALQTDPSFVLPLLPTEQHFGAASPDRYADYKHQIACTDCHLA